MRRFGLWEEAQQMSFEVFPQVSLFRDDGDSVRSSVLLVEMKCPLQFIKELFNLEIHFATEALFEQCIQTVHMLVVETE